MKLGEGAIIKMSKRPLNTEGDGLAQIYRFQSNGKVFVGKFCTAPVEGDGGSPSSDSRSSDDSATKRANLKMLQTEWAFYKAIGRHKNIAIAHGMATHPLGGEDQPVLLMEFVDGINGDDLRLGMQAGLENGHISYLEFCGMEALVGRETLTAIAHWTSENIVHCDLKSQNVMIDKMGNVKIIDFGLARRVGTRGLGSVNYKAPEQFASQCELDNAEKTGLADAKAPEQFANQTKLDETEEFESQQRVGRKTDPFAVGVSTLAVFGGHSYGFLDAPLFFKLNSYLTELKPSPDMGEEDLRYVADGALGSLEAYLTPFLTGLNDRLQGEPLSPEEVEIWSKEFENQCQVWLEQYTTICLTDRVSSSKSALEASTKHGIFADLVESFKESIQQPGVPYSNLPSEMRPPNTGLIIDGEIRKDKFGKIIRRRGVFAAKTAVTEFIDLTMKKRCTAEEALAHRFIADSVVEEARAAELLKMVVAKTRDGSIFQPKVSVNPSTKIRGIAVKGGRDQSKVEERSGAGVSLTEKKVLLHKHFIKRPARWGVGTFRDRVNLFDLLERAKAEASQSTPKRNNPKPKDHR
jgi:serine/threonine protein kinase